MRLIRRLSDNNFIRNVLTLVSGTVAAQAIGFAASPIITRIYAPEAFGVLGVFTSVVSLLSPIGALAFPIAIVLPQNVRNACRLVQLSIIVGLAFTSIVALIMIFGSERIANYFELDQLGALGLLVPLVVFINVLVDVAQQWAIRGQAFFGLARATTVTASITSVGQVLVGLLQPSANSLIAIFSMSRAIHLLLLLPRTARGQPAVPVSHIAEPSLTLWQVVRKYRQFPFYRAPELFINGLSQGLPVVILAGAFGPSVAGFYALSRSVLGVPTQLLGNSVGSVFYPRVTSAIHNDERVSCLLWRATRTLAIAGILPYLIVIIMGPTLFAWVFGDNWLIAGEFARWLAIWRYFSLVNRPAVQALQALNAQRTHLVISVVGTAVRLALLSLITAVWSNAEVSIAVYGVSGMITSSAVVFFALRLASQHDWRASQLS